MLDGRVSGRGMNFGSSKCLVTLLRARIIAAQCDWTVSDSFVKSQIEPVPH